MQIPSDKNTRAEAMWRIISQCVDFRGKRVIDLGCGTGDFLWRVGIAGAQRIDGVDNVDRISLELHQAMFAIVGDKGYYMHADIDGDKDQILEYQEYDIAFCFSVLPYLDDVPATLKWMSSNFPSCLIECQYAGDGPGLPNIGGDKGMMQLLLSNGFSSAEVIGKTEVEGREYQSAQVYRTIWLCEAKED